MEAQTLRIRIAGLQTPISRIRSLAAATIEMANQITGIENETHRGLIEHMANFAELILQEASQAGAEAEDIEIDTPKQIGGR